MVDHALCRVGANARVSRDGMLRDSTLRERLLDAWFHFGLSAGRWEFETEISNTPQAAAFWFTNVKRSSNAAFKRGIMKVVSPSCKTQLIVSSSIIKAGDPGVLVLGFTTGDTRPSGVMHSICAPPFARSGFSL